VQHLLGFFKTYVLDRKSHFTILMKQGETQSFPQPMRRVVHGRFTSHNDAHKEITLGWLCFFDWLLFLSLSLSLSLSPTLPFFLSSASSFSTIVMTHFSGQIKRSFVELRRRYRSCRSPTSPMLVTPTPTARRRGIGVSVSKLEVEIKRGARKK